MELLYVSAAHGRSNHDDGTTVRIERVGGKEKLIMVYEFSQAGFNRAKLRAIAQFFYDVKLNPNSKITIFADSAKIAYDWNNNVRVGDMKGVDCQRQWNYILDEFKRYKYVPSIENTGVLSMAMRDALKIEMPTY